MNKPRKFLIFGVIAVVLAFGIMLGKKKARAHVNYKTAVDDHPLTCWTCHIYTQKDNFIARMMNETYISPYNLAISGDGNSLYVIGQESKQLLVVNTPSLKERPTVPVTAMVITVQ